MIKFVASDLDGTLLDQAHRLPEETFDMIDRLYKKGILFCPASGRQYDNLRNLFRSVADKVVFMAENGALLKYKEETLFILPIDKKQIKFALDVLRKENWARIVLCCENTAYTETKEDPFYSLTKDAYTSLQVVDNLDDLIERENTCKIAVFDKTANADIHADAIRDKLPALRTVVSGKEWLDISSPDVNKGIAIEKIREKFSLTKDECLAFGDHMNDYEMLLACGHPFVTENAYPPLKEMIGNIIPSNQEKGVLRYLDDLLKTTP